MGSTTHAVTFLMCYFSAGDLWPVHLHLYYIRFIYFVGEAQSDSQTKPQASHRQGHFSSISTENARARPQNIFAVAAGPKRGTRIEECSNFRTVIESEKFALASQRRSSECLKHLDAGERLNRVII